MFSRGSNSTRLPRGRLPGPERVFSRRPLELRFDPKESAFGKTPAGLTFYFFNAVRTRHSRPPSDRYFYFRAPPRSGTCLLAEPAPTPFRPEGDGIAAAMFADPRVTFRTRFECATREHCPIDIRPSAMNPCPRGRPKRRRFDPKETELLPRCLRISELLFERGSNAPLGIIVRSIFRFSGASPVRNVSPRRERSEPVTDRS